MSNNQSTALLRDYGCNSLNELVELTTFNAMYDLLNWLSAEYINAEGGWQHPDFLQEHLDKVGQLPPAELHRRRREVMNRVSAIATGQA